MPWEGHLRWTIWWLRSRWAIRAERRRHRRPAFKGDGARRVLALSRPLLMLAWVVVAVDAVEAEAVVLVAVEKEA
eukprot:scaffold64786_cov40-Prasinocladus_malaysianus.AAC.1